MPDICSLKQHRELAGSANNPLKKHYRISESELDDYHKSNSTKVVNTFHPHPSNVLQNGYWTATEVIHQLPKLK